MTQRYVVQCALNAPAPVRFAASELARYMQAAFGVDIATGTARQTPKLQIRLVSEQEQGSPPRPLSLTGRLRPIKPALAPLPGVDAFLWRVSDGELSIAGTNGRSALYGVYDALEDLAGCRFCGPHSEDEVIPSKPAAELATVLDRPLERFEQAAMAYRGRSTGMFLEMEEVSQVVREVDWMAKRRLNLLLIDMLSAQDGYGWQKLAQRSTTNMTGEVWAALKAQVFPELKRRGLLLCPGLHGFYPLLLPVDLYAEKHPEWYALREGRRVGGFRKIATDMSGGPAPDGCYQFCTTNPDARAAFLDNMVRFLDENPEIDLIQPCPEDGLDNWCECPQCSKQSVGDRQMDLDNAIAERVRQVRPQMRVLPLVYGSHLAPPEHVLPAEGTDIGFSAWGRDYAYSATDERTYECQFHPLSPRELLEQWAKLCDEVGAGLLIHSKFMRFEHLDYRLLPLPHVQTDMRFYQRIGVDGMDYHVGEKGWWVKNLNSYMAAELTWDPDQEVDDLIEDYFLHYWQDLAADARMVADLINAANPDLSYWANIGGGANIDKPPLTSQKRREHRQSINAAMTKYPQAIKLIEEMRSKLANSPHLSRRVRLLRAATTAAYQLAQIHAELLAADELVAAAQELDLKGVSVHLQRAQEAVARAAAVLATATTYQTPALMRQGVLWQETLAVKNIWPSVIETWQSYIQQQGDH